QVPALTHVRASVMAKKRTPLTVGTLASRLMSASASAASRSTAATATSRSGTAAAASMTYELSKAYTPTGWTMTARSTPATGISAANDWADGGSCCHQGEPMPVGLIG